MKRILLFIITIVSLFIAKIQLGFDSISMRKIIFLCLITFVFTLNAEVKPPTVIPPSPEAAAFAKYTFFPVDMFFGTPQISLPLYEIKTKELSFPITLSYNASGIKVQEAASNVGLGWLLNATGCISVMVQGASDIRSPFGHGYIKEGQYNVNNLTLTMNRKAYTDKIYDLAADIYCYNLGGNSGKFCFLGNEVDSVAFLPEYKPLKVHYNTSTGSKYDYYNFGGFSIKDENGITYNFNAVENFIPVPGGKDFIHPSAFFLTSIVSTNKTDSICFYYSMDARNEYTYNYSGMNCGSITLPQAVAGPTQYDESKSLGVSSYNTYVLDSICFLNGKVIVDKTQGRSDEGNGFGWKYDGLRIIDSNNNLIKQIKFYNSYFTTSSSANYLGKRLRLDSLAIGNKTADETYVFSYDSKALPLKSSKQQDYWGVS